MFDQTEIKGHSQLTACSQLRPLALDEDGLTIQISPFIEALEQTSHPQSDICLAETKSNQIDLKRSVSPFCEWKYRCILSQ